MSNQPWKDKTSEPWRVGVLFSRSGYMALIEETQYRGTMIAIDEINESGGINGRELVPAVFDPASDNSAASPVVSGLIRQISG